MFAWKNGVFKFRNQSFEQIARILERKYDIQIKVESKVLKQEYFTGSFSARSPIEQILKEVDVDSKYRWFRKGNELV
ncbi:MAG: DUF4974 domain-containing protein, partial [Tannerellaceae bacterium]|nr:DUF4974 domain-containing protein [Tannerellaceae bacterium]